MASSPRVGKRISLEEFLRLPEIDEQPFEIVSPKQSLVKCREKLAFSIGNGCLLGWLIDPIRKQVTVYRPNQPGERLLADGVLDGEPVLPGYRLPLAQLFGWLKRRPPNPPAPPAQAGPSGGEII